MDQPDDTALIEQVQRGDQQAFTVLMERWQTRIHRFAFRFFANVDEASEITQKTFIKVYQKVDTLDEPRKFSSWIYRVANNLCLDELKRAGRRKSSPLEAWVEQKESSQTPVQKLETKELGEVLRQPAKRSEARPYRQRDRYDPGPVRPVGKPGNRNA